MKFSDFICREAIRTNLEANEKKAVIRAMATSLVEAGKINEKDFESIVEAILKREELGSTGIGRGVAVPHTKHPSAKDLIGAVAVSGEGVFAYACAQASMNSSLIALRKFDRM